MPEGDFKGFILTRQWRDARAGTEIEFWLATGSGPRKVVLRSQTSVAFAAVAHTAVVESQLRGMPGVELRELDLKTFDREPVFGVYARHYRDLGRLSKSLAVHGVPLLEADIRPHDRYLMERFITAAVEVEGGQWEGDVLVDPRLKPCADYRPALKVVSLDIETSRHGALYSIALDMTHERVVYMLGEAPVTPANVEGFELVYCPSRAALIERLNDWFHRHDPDVIVGWSVVQFDLRILQKTADEAGMKLLLGRERREIEWRSHPGKRGYLFAPMAGRVVIDGIEALRSAVWSFPSFSLESVSQALLGEGKEIGDEYDKMAEIERRYQEDKPALASYNIRDCELVLRIFEKTRLLQFVMERAHTTGLQMDHFGGSIAAFTHVYLPRMHRLGYVAPNVDQTPSGSYPGGYVLDSVPGFYDSVVVLDYKSLYPSIIRTFLVDPVGFVEGMAATDMTTVVPGPGGTLFSRDKHALPAITSALWSARDEAKRTRNEPLSQALKLLMNSFSGVLGAPGGRFFNPKVAAAVTLRGHEMMRLTRDLVEQRGYRAIYGDTDSIFIWLRRAHATAEAHDIAEGLVRDINDWWARTLKQEHGLESHLEIEFDTHYRKFFMPTIRGSELGSKKRYAGLSVAADGKEEMVFRGLEMARSDWTLLARRFQEGLLGRIFHDEPYEAFVLDVVQSLLAGKLDDQLVYRKRLRRQLDAYEVNVPPQVRAARLADEFNDERDRPRQYQNGGWIRYVMTRNGPEPMEARRSEIDYEHYLAKQLEPIADVILQPLGQSLASLTTAQQGLF